jgi:phage terminase large subunit
VTPIDASFPEKLELLFQPARYKVLYGGRGGAKSWGIARALLLEAADNPLRVLCAREIQKSMKESVHQLLKDQIEALGLDGFYTVFNDEIRGANGSLFLFAGLKHNIANIKSKEGIDRVWVEEAQTVSKHSWDTLVPTIRKEGSEIWVSFNPELETDETYRRFVKTPPADAVVVKVNWSDNPWFPEVLRAEKDHLLAVDPDAYLWVWEGHCKVVLDGAIYAREVREAITSGRFCRVPYDASKPVHTFWDLGRADMTSIWFAQVVGFEFRLIDFYQNRGFALNHYLQELQKRPYVWGEDWMPHDAENRLLGAERTIAEQMKDVGRKVRIVPKIPVADGINAGRTIFPQCFFDADKCADGIQSLQRYRYKVDDQGQWSKEPLHDDFSHAADAFRYFATAMKAPSQVERPKLKLARGRPGGWMG